MTPCAYHRCTQTPQPDTQYVWSPPKAPPLIFCSVTCGWSWLQEQVDAPAPSVPSTGETTSVSRDTGVSTRETLPPARAYASPRPSTPRATPTQTFTPAEASVTSWNPSRRSWAIDLEDAVSVARRKAQDGMVQLNEALKESSVFGQPWRVKVVHDRVSGQAPIVEWDL